MKIKMNVPNWLTMIRIFCTPLIVLMFMLPIQNGVGIYIALGIYVLACITDLLDGFIARKYNQVTDFGKFMDQIADKFITTTAMVLVLFSGVTQINLAIGMILLVVLRDILVSGVRMVAASKNLVIPADIYGKVKSFFLDAGTMVLMLYLGLQVVHFTRFVEIVRTLGVAILLVGVVLSVISGVNYVVKACKALSKQEETKTESKEEKVEEVEKQTKTKKSDK